MVVYIHSGQPLPVCPSFCPYSNLAGFASPTSIRMPLATQETIFRLSSDPTVDRKRPGIWANRKPSPSSKHASVRDIFRLVGGSSLSRTPLLVSGQSFSSGDNAVQFRNRAVLGHGNRTGFVSLINVHISKTKYVRLRHVTAVCADALLLVAWEPLGA
jgi:hypothetical protein